MEKISRPENKLCGNKYITEQDLADTLQNKLSEFEKMYGLPVECNRAWGIRLENVLKRRIRKNRDAAGRPGR